MSMEIQLVTAPQALHNILITM